MKVLLCYKNSRELERIERTRIPIGLLWIGAALKKAGHEVLIENFSCMEWDEVKEFIAEEKPDLVGTVMTYFNRWQILKLAGIVKRINYHTPVILGGEFAAASYEEVLKKSNDIDIVVLGEGEETMVEILTTVKDCSVDNLKKIKGIAFWSHNDALFTKPQENGMVVIKGGTPLDANQLEIPALYFTYNQILTSRGCENVRFRDAGKVVEEIDSLMKKGIREFHIVDYMSTSDAKRFQTICKELMQRSLAWTCKADITTMEEATLEWMKKAGCYEVEYSITSTDKDLFSKAKQVAEQTRKAGISMTVRVTVGNVGESDETIKELLGLLQGMKPQRVTTEFLRLFPGKELFDQEVKAGTISKNVWFATLMHLPFETLYHWEENKEKLTQWLKIVVGFARDNLKNYKFTEQELEGLTQKYPKDVWARNALAKIYAKQGDLEKTEKILLDAGTLNQGFVNSFINLGILYEKKGDLEKAEKNYLKAVEIDFANPVTHKNLGNVYVKLNKITEAVKSYEQAMTLNHAKFGDLRLMVDNLQLALKGAEYDMNYN